MSIYQQSNDRILLNEKKAKVNDKISDSGMFTEKFDNEKINKR